VICICGHHEDDHEPGGFFRACQGEPEDGFDAKPDGTCYCTDFEPDPNRGDD
jgi:hypothetical protein